MAGSFKVFGNIADPLNRRLFNGAVCVRDGIIGDIVKLSDDIDPEMDFIMPGFIDSHVHIESSMMLPDMFARSAARSGVVGAVADPHEIANVLGLDGVRLMIGNAGSTPFHFMFAAPSCVPSTGFETAGATLDACAVKEMLSWSGIGALAEVMNVSEVLYGDRDMLAKFDAARAAGKPIDGHAPGLSGDGLKQYALAGITTNHECSTESEAREQAAAGLYILIREGSAARNFDALSPLVGDLPDSVMFCTDDCHPDFLQDGRYYQHVKRSIARGYPLWNVLRAASVTPVKHYGLPVGLLQKGDSADFIIVDNLKDFNCKATFLSGTRYDSINPLPADEHRKDEQQPNNFKAGHISKEDIALKPSCAMQKVIVAYDGQLVTGIEEMEALMKDGRAVSDPSRDMLKIVVINRYDRGAKTAVGFIKGFGISKGALASSVAHDSHNIIALGASDEDIVRAVNRIADTGGGLAAVCGERMESLALPVAGIMSPGTDVDVLDGYLKVRKMAQSMSPAHSDAFMTMSFMTLPVIPALKITDKGLFDFASFSLIPGE